jgi:lysophospholipase L1-like esterase
VIWQFGTNFILHGRPLDSLRPAVTSALARARQAHADVVFMDVQYAPWLLHFGELAPVLRTMDAIASEQRLNLLSRFNLMKAWSSAAHIAPEDLLWRDGFHPNDTAYRCVAATLAKGLLRHLEPAVIAKEPVRIRLRR